MSQLETEAGSSGSDRAVADGDRVTPGAGATRRKVALGGGALAILVQLWLITEGSFDLFRVQPSADFFDAQARALLGGHTWVPAQVAGIEGIVVDGRTQIYFGPFPALLRLPVALFTDSLDGRLAGLSMLVAAGIVAFASVRLLGQARRLRRPQSTITTADTIAAGLVAFLVPTGTTVLFLASRTQVYHEASMWGVAMSLLALSFVIDAAQSPTARTLTIASAASAAAILSRVSVGLGPAVALALLAVVLTYRARRPAWWAGAAAAAPFVAYALVNWIRFRTLFSIPLRQQVQNLIDPTRPAFFAENGGFFGLQFFPTSFSSYLNPFGIRLSGWFPLVDFPPLGDPIRNGVRFDAIDRVASAPATMPALVVLAIAGAVILVRRQSPESLRIAALGAGAGCATILVFGYIAHRYLADFIPLLVVLGVVAIDALIGARPGAARRWAIAGISVLALVGVWTNLGLGLLQQGAWGTELPPSAIARFVDARLQVNDWLGLKDPVIHAVPRGGTLPTDAAPGDFAIVGNCDALYFFAGGEPNFLEPTKWHAVEGTRGSGSRQFEARFAAAAAGTTDPLIVVGDQDRSGVIGLEHLGGGRARITWQGPPGNYHSSAFDLSPGRHRIDVAADPYIRELTVDLDGDTVLRGPLGTSGISVAPDGATRELTSNRAVPLCRSIQP